MPHISLTEEQEVQVAAFKMLADKVHCISRVSSLIMNLLSLAQDKSLPALDDFVHGQDHDPRDAGHHQGQPSQPPLDRLSAEDCYWWLQLVGAVQFIKTMDYVRQ